MGITVIKMEDVTTRDNFGDCRRTGKRGEERTIE